MAKKEKEVNKKTKKNFFKDMKAELKKVIWPTAKQTANNTVAVIAFTLAIAVIVFILDLGFDALNKNGIVALQEKVKSSYSANTTEENTSSEETSDDATAENKESDSESENATKVEADTKSKK